MKIDYIKEYDLTNPKDCIFRIYDFGSEEVKKLIELIGELIEGEVSEINLKSLSFIRSVGGVNLVLRLGPNDKGVIRGNGNDFVCTLSKVGWENAIGLAKPFAETKDTNDFQWLYDLNTEIDLLLSRNGKW